MTPSSLEAWLAYLERLHPTSIDMGLDRCREVAARLGLGKPAPRIVTVTGTNGKGSTCAFLAELLAAAGRRVGLYSSPHLLRYNERVRIDGSPVDDASLCRAFAAVEAARDGVSLTYFEMGTLAAFWLFEQAQLDVVVLEVGLGGRLDAVNLVDADVSVVTSIGLDHAEWLGDSRESVAFEKAGIFRQRRPVVCGEIDPPAALLERASALKCPLLLRGRDFDLSVDHTQWHWSGRDGSGNAIEFRELPRLTLPMDNAACALQVFVLLEHASSSERIDDALQRTRLPGRFDRRALDFDGKSLTIMFDVGHNPHAAGYLARRLREAPAMRRLAVFGLLADKDLPGVVGPLSSLVDHWAVTPLPTPRSRSAAELSQVLAAQGARVEECDSVSAALLAQCERARSGDEVLVFGSFYVVAEGLDWLARR
jgi:dihydrofolate synthase/folylpolyglutamate synthase